MIKYLLMERILLGIGVKKEETTMKEKLSLFELSSQEKGTAAGGKATVTVGPVCSCGCQYVDCGGSSHFDNEMANCESGLHTPASAGCD
jgi:hypothetical protein